MTDTVECGIYAVDFIRDELREGVVYEIDGSIIKSKLDYLSVCSYVFGFPIKNETMWDQYSDWVTDFTWLPGEDKEAQITVFITHYAEMLQEDFKNKQLAIDIFYEDVFPFWSKEVANIMVGGKPRSFKVYLMAGDGTEEGQGPRLNPVEYRLATGDNAAGGLKRAWFAYGDGTFPREVERVIEAMAPGEMRTVVLSGKVAAPDSVAVEVAFDDVAAEALGGVRAVLLETPAGSALASILDSEGNTVSLGLSEAAFSFSLEIHIPEEGDACYGGVRHDEFVKACNGKKA